MGDGEKTPLKLNFDPKVRLEFRGATITSDAGLLACRELDDALSLGESGDNYLKEGGTGKKILHHLIPLLRQSVYSRLAGYDDTKHLHWASAECDVRHRDSELRDEEVTIYYDGGCTFCRTGVPLLRRLLLLRRTRLKPGQQLPEVDQLMRAGNTWVVVGPAGRTRTEFEALTYLCQRSPLFWPFSYILRVPPLPYLGRLGYRLTARHRWLWGRP